MKAVRRMLYTGLGLVAVVALLGLLISRSIVSPLRRLGTRPKAWLTEILTPFRVRTVFTES